MKLIVILTGFLILTACNIKRRCLELFPPVIQETNERIIEKKDTILPQVVISYAIPEEPMIGEQDVIIIKDTTGYAELRLKYDSRLRKWMAECEAKERKVSWEQVTNYITRLERRTDVKKVIPKWIKIILALAIIQTLYMCISILKKSKFL